MITFLLLLITFLLLVFPVFLSVICSLLAHYLGIIARNTGKPQQVIIQEAINANIAAKAAEDSRKAAIKAAIIAQGERRLARRTKWSQF